MNLPDLMRSYGVELRRQGQKYWAVCPFHGDKSPSMTVSEHRGKWRFYCFGCGEHGDGLDFVMKKTGCSFPDAKTKLGIPDDLDRRQARQDRDQQKQFEVWRRELAHGLHLLVCMAEKMARVSDENTAEMMLRWQMDIAVLFADEDGSRAMYQENRRQVIADAARGDYERRL